MPSNKHNLIFAIFALLKIALFRDVPFCQPQQQLQCLHHGSTKAHICSQLCSIPFSTTMLVMICSTRVMALVRDLGKCSARRGGSYVILATESVQSAGSETKWSYQMTPSLLN